MTMEELRAKLQTSTYQPKTEEQMQQEAQNRYRGVYEQQKLSAQQNYDATAQALQNQLATLGTAYDRQAKEAQAATDAAISAADRRSLSRGMQRSSYNAATLANLANKGNEALADIQADRTAAEGDIAGKQTLAAQQLRDQLAQLDNTYAADVQAAIDALKEQEYARQQEADQYNNNLLMQLFEMEEAVKDNELARALQEEKLRAARGASGGSSSSGSGSSGGTTGGVTGNTAPANTAFGTVTPETTAGAVDLLNRLDGMGSATPPTTVLGKLSELLKTSSMTPDKKKNITTTVAPSKNTARSGYERREKRGVNKTA